MIFVFIAVMLLVLILAFGLQEWQGKRARIKGYEKMRRKFDQIEGGVDLIEGSVGRLR